MEKKNYFGINIDNINSVINTGTWERTSNGVHVVVACLTAIEGDPEEYYRMYYPNTVEEIKGELKDAIVQIDQPSGF